MCTKFTRPILKLQTGNIVIYLRLWNSEHFTQIYGDIHFNCTDAIIQQIKL